MRAKVELVKVTGATSIFIDAAINEGGDLVISGQDVGEVPRAAFGDSDYEYWLTVRGEHKDAMFRALRELAGSGPPSPETGSDAGLLELLARLYGGDALVVSKLQALLEAKGVPCEFFTY